MIFTWDQIQTVVVISNGTISESPIWTRIRKYNSMFVISLNQSHCIALVRNHLYILKSIIRIMDRDGFRMHFK